MIAAASAAAGAATLEGAWPPGWASGEPDAALLDDPHGGDDDAPAAHAPERAARSGAVAEPSAEQLSAWMRRIVERDDRALAALYDAIAGRVHALVLRIVRRPAQADEVVEDCFWQVWREAPRYESARGSVLAWVMSIARSRAIDGLRRHEVHARHEAPLPDAVDELLADPAPAPPDLLETTQRDHRLHALLEALDPLPRQLLSLAFFCGLTHPEIAAQCGLPLGTVKSHLRRALLQLRPHCEAAGLGGAAPIAEPPPEPGEPAAPRLETP